MIKLSNLLFCCSLSLCVSLAFADTVAPALPASSPSAVSSETGNKTTPSLVNTAQVSVLDESSTATQVGLKAAFSEVMIKLSGNPDIMNNPEIQSLAGNVAQFVQSYSFSNENNPPPQKPSLLLNVVFDKGALEKIQKTLMAQLPQTQSDTPLAAPQKKNDTVTLLITGIRNLQDYHALILSLQGIPNVRRVETDKILPDRINLSVDISGGSQPLITALDSNTHFQALTMPNAQNNTTLFYSWIS